MGMSEESDRRIQAQIKEPLAVNRARRTLTYLEGVARLSSHERVTVCETMRDDHKEYVEIRAAYSESRKATRDLLSTLKEKNNER